MLRLATKRIKWNEKIKMEQNVLAFHICLYKTVLLPTVYSSLVVEVVWWDSPLMNIGDVVDIMTLL